MKTVSFWEFYLKEVRTRLCDIDIFIHFAENDEEPLNIRETAAVLDITESEIQEIMKALGVKSITQNNFYKVMEKGSSFICKIFARELECGSPICYTIDDISYIYEIDHDHLKQTCDGLHIKEVTGLTLPMIFKNIPYNL